MQTSWGQLFIGVLLWSLVMLVPFFISYYQTINPAVSVALLTTVYPALIAYLSRRGSFWISYEVILISAVIALVTGLFLIYVVKSKSTLIVDLVPILAFILSLAGLSTQLDMYGSNAYA